MIWGCSKIKITEVKVQWIRIPLTNPASFSIKTLNYRDYLLVRILSDEGIEGVGVTLNDSSAAPAMAAATDLLAPLLIGKDPRDISALWELMFYQTVRAGRRGNTLFALSALDIALWDHQAKLANLPLYKLLGGYRHKVPCYASGGYYQQDGEELEKLIEEATSYVQAGFQAMKIKIGRLSLAEEEQRIQAVRSVIGEQCELFVDAGQAWHDVNEAVRFAKLCEKYSIGWLEEPLPMDMIEGYRRLAQRANIPIATGEVGSTRWEFSSLEGIQIAQHDATVCGGISEWLKITDLCAEKGISVAPHYFWDIHIHLAASRREVTWIEYFTDNNIVNMNLILNEPIVPTNGWITLPEKPGVGLELNEGAVTKYLQKERIVAL